MGPCDVPACLEAPGASDLVVPDDVDRRFLIALRKYYGHTNDEVNVFHALYILNLSKGAGWKRRARYGDVLHPRQPGDQGRGELLGVGPYLLPQPTLNPSSTTTGTMAVATASTLSSIPLRSRSKVRVSNLSTSAIPSGTLQAMLPGKIKHT